MLEILEEMGFETTIEKTEENIVTRRLENDNSTVSRQEEISSLIKEKEEELGFEEAMNVALYKTNKEPPPLIHKPDKNKTNNVYPLK